MILIDNYDSFTYNIVQYLLELGIEPKIFKNNEITLAQLGKIEFESILISPGPNNPDNAGICLDVIDKFYKTKKILGICLGHQCLAQYFGCKIIKDKNPTHGKVSAINFNQKCQLFDTIPQKFSAMRYHSLIVDKKTVGANLEINATTNDGIIMGINHKNYPLYGLQFHPESILSEYGKTLLQNFIYLKNNTSAKLNTEIKIEEIIPR